jgi:hypothetical protein
LEHGYNMDLRARVALQMLERHGLVAGHVVREDGSQRAITDLQPLDVTISRIFDLAAAYVAEAEQRGLLKMPEQSPDQLAVEHGRIVGVQEDARFTAKTATLRK